MNADFIGLHPFACLCIVAVVALALFAYAHGKSTAAQVAPPTTGPNPDQPVVPSQG